MRKLGWMLVSLALVAAPAAAQPRSYLMQPVRLADLNIRSDAGERAMERRLAAASRELCAAIRSPLFPGAEGRAFKCRREALAAARARLKAPRQA
jgi:UrcA family protein